MNRLSCQVQLEARSIAVAPITAAARNQGLGDTMPFKAPQTPCTNFRPQPSSHVIRHRPAKSGTEGTDAASVSAHRRLATGDYG
jgi:hypothetical protein